MIRMLPRGDVGSEPLATTIAKKSSVVQRVVLPDTGQIHFKGPNQDTLITYLNELTGALGAAFDVRPAHTTPQDWMLLRSPAGHIWQITVSDTGVLTTTQIFQQT